MFAQAVSAEIENEVAARLAFIESELAAYRTENERLAKELEVALRVIAALPFTNPAALITQVADARRLPRSILSGEDVFFHIDLCESGERLVHIAGWAFCPRIDCGNAIVSLLLGEGDYPLFAMPGRTRRPDVAAAYEYVDLGPSLPLGDEGRRRLAESGFAVMVARASLTSDRSYKLLIQIDGPDFSVRKSTGISVHV